MRFFEQGSGSGKESKQGSSNELLKMTKMTLDSIHPSARRFQEAVLRNMTPLLAKCRTLSFKKMLTPNTVVYRSSQQTELIKWQQEMFHRILNMMCLVEEGLTEVSELDAFREALLRTLTISHPNGEWADFTRDKLLFLQDLFQSRCISEEDYHKAKRPIMARLAEQGAELDSQDFKFNSKEIGANTESAKDVEKTPTRELSEAPPSPAAAASGSSSAKKTPIKHVMDAVARLKGSSSGKKNNPNSTNSEERVPRVPHALDFVRHDPRDCPTREAPVAAPKKPQEIPLDSPLFFDVSTGSTRDLLEDDPQSPASVPSSPPISSLLTPPSNSSTTLAESKSLLKPPRKLTFTPSKTTLGFTRSESKRLPLTESSPKGKPEKSLSQKFSYLFKNWQGGDSQRLESDSEDSDDPNADSDEEWRTPKKQSVWKKLDLLRPATKKQLDDDDDFGKEISDKDPLLSAIEDYPSDKIKDRSIHGQGPNMKKLKKKIAVRAAPTNFFIDQVLGDNIKSELSRIRGEMARSNPGNQAFTNDQIDAVATRLPVDKTELMRFFPKSWCDRYGDIVLEVVHKEFTSHVSEMDGLRKTARGKKTSSINEPENDENKRAESRATGDKQSATQRSHSPGMISTKTPAKAFLTRCHTTNGSEMKSASVHKQRDNSSSMDHRGQPRRGLGFENDLDIKLGAEILRMPFRNFNDSSITRS